MEVLNKDRGYDLSPSPHEGSEFVDSAGNHYDLVGGHPNLPKHFDADSFNASIDSHLLKSNDYTIVDVRNLSAEQQTQVRKHIDSLTEEQRKRIKWEQ